MSAPIGYYVAPDEVECADCYRPDAWPGYEDWEAPEPIYYGTTASAPLHCRLCWNLIPHALTDHGQEYVRKRLVSGRGNPKVLGRWFEVYGADLGLDGWNRERADRGGNPCLAEVVVPPMGDTYWFPAEGKKLRDVTLTVHWSPYGTSVRWDRRPFAPADPITSGFDEVRYPGRDHATSRRQARQIAEELFTYSRECLHRRHQECRGRHATPDWWPEAYACLCPCHEGDRR